MPRRGGSRQPENRRSQPSRASSHSIQGGRAGRGRGETHVSVSPPAFSPAPYPPLSAVLPPSRPSEASSSSSAPQPHVPSSAASSVVSASGPVDALSSELEPGATLQPSAPSSSKAIRFPDRPNYGKIGKKTLVRANHFMVQVANRDIHHYDVSITPEVISKNINRKVISQLIKLYSESHLGKHVPAYDGRKSLFTGGPLPFNSMVFAVKLLNKDEQATSSDSARKEREFRVTIRYASKPDVHHLQQFLARLQLDVPQETIQALDVALRASPAEKFTVVGRSFFSPLLGQKGELGCGLEYWRGYHQSLRPTQMGLSLNIDVSARSFYEEILVTEFIGKHISCNLSRRLSDQDRVKVKKALRGVKVDLIRNGYRRSYKVSGISKEPLSELTFTLDDKKTKKAVVQYFREKYNIALKYLALPALQSGSDTKPVYLPMELCRIAAGQRYSKRLNETQVTALLRATCQRPPEREAYIKQMVRQNNFSRDKLVHEEFGIQVREELALIEARVLPAPTLKYHDTGRESRVEPRMGQWNMINKKMVDGGKVQHWTCLNFSTRVDRDLPFQFCYELVNMCISKGMIFNQDPLIPISSANSRQIDNALLNVHNQSAAKLKSMKKDEEKLQLLIIILPDIRGSYGTIKRICETELGIVSQCVQPRQASRLNKQYLENVSLKINVKMGGRNTVLNDAVLRRIPLVTDRPTIIFGADVTHPQPGEDSSPSIAAVVASMDWPEITKYRGLMSAQSHREEIIEDLYTCVTDPQRGVVPGGMIRELLIAFRRSTNIKPDRIIFYRDGVSEGQFSQVLLHEMEAIRKACASLEEGYLPRVTFVVVQKRHHTRLFPADYNSRDQMDRSGNILPGTVVDTHICHPREFDFFLNSHAGIQGMNRPAHYHLLFDENHFNADQLQTFTNNLCYTFARCTRSVSLVPPAYYAHLAAFRARYYIEGGESESDSGSGSRATGARALPQIKKNVKDVMFYC